jgi:hypothetical protein
MPRASLATFTLAVSFLLLSGCHDLCVNDVLSESLSPDGSKRAVLFLRDCGATTDFSWQISILGSKETLTNGAGNVIVLDNDHGAVHEMKVEVEWKGSDNLIVSYPDRARIFHQLTMIRGVRISYETVKHPPLHGV